MTLKCLIFDFGNVIAFFDHRKACRQLSKLSKGKFSESDIYDDLFSPSGLENQYDRGAISTDEFINEIKRRYKIPVEKTDVELAWCDIFSLNKVMIELIKRLKDKGYRLILASNTNELHYKWFKNKFANELILFDDEVISFQIGFRKPEKEFFTYCVTKSEVQSIQCVFIDDRLDFIKIARELGSRGIWYTSIDYFPHDLAAVGIKDEKLLSDFTRPTIQPRGDFADIDKEVSITIYREKYSNFRHFDAMRWQIPSLVFLVAGAVMGFAPKLTNGYPAPWVLIVYGVFVVLCAWLMSRISFNMRLNTEALHLIASKIGDHSIPKSPGKRGAVFWIEKFFWLLGFSSIVAGIYFSL